MAKTRTETIGEFNGLGAQVNAANLPGKFAEVFQNWRFDEQGVLMPRYGIVHSMRIRWSTAGTGIPNTTDALAEIESDNKRYILSQAGGHIVYMRASANGATFTSGANGAAQWDAQRSIEPAPKQATIPYKHRTRYAAVPKVASASWTTATGGHTVTVEFQKGTGSFGSNGTTVSNTSLQQLCPYIMGVEMILDGRTRHKWVYATEGDYSNERFATVSVATAETKWQFRYIYQDGSRGPLSRENAMTKV